MNKLTLSLACTQTDRAAPILDGRISISGCDVIPLPGITQTIFRQVLDEQAFDIAEMSMASHLIQVDRGVRDYVAIPVFLSRSFRHSSIYINKDSGIKKPEDLRGRTIGVQQFQQTVGLWVRGMLGDQYGVRSQDVKWMNGGFEAPGGGERLQLDLPEAISLEPIPATETLNEMLADGRLDALIATKPPSSFASGDPRVGRLFPDYPSVEKEYYRNTEAFPIMHCVVIRQSLVDAHPWLPAEVFKAFVQAKALALEEMKQVNILRLTLPWIAETAAEVRDLIGENVWKYGFKESKPEMETMLRYAHGDGLTGRLLAPEDVFHASPLTLADKI
ncbi:ABC transporter substrate-binding protein [Parasedimentitalea psychrophila]|uniref:ABC transporter substrate-binding protein n=1 Tax=Parasedimentitalea psychrophila TaxID=2997337 RepID=A0A9Y2L0L7_9RHOB|nr:ABC transporter substrate-binding protein [Parasedimentitalea psychrophila]WIY26570.1 ABC transporter substrate-binding protein [Parasedimentitalea psychrophila]